MQFPRSRFMRPRGLTRAERWTLAAGGVLTEANRETFETFGMRASQQAVRTLLAQWWTAPDRASLLERLEWLRSEGHREHLRQTLLETDRLLAERPPDAPVQLSEHGEFLVNHRHLLGPAPFVAWDQGRLINVARWGHSAGYLTEEEGWRWAREAAWTMRNAFGSWEEQTADYVLGCRYWALDKVPVAPFLAAQERLRTHPASPWRSLAWEIPPYELTLRGR